MYHRLQKCMMDYFRCYSDRSIVDIVINMMLCRFQGRRPYLSRIVEQYKVRQISREPLLLCSV